MPKPRLKLKKIRKTAKKRELKVAAVVPARWAGLVGEVLNDLWGRVCLKEVVAQLVDALVCEDTDPGSSPVVCILFALFLSY
ncbi:hypothetical protein HanIR_Chr15g0767721 [Helianthus annuus]|nr:hypothetical protein HanIR_Chr15g0767721 [Helianthus annuus]